MNCKDCKWWEREGFGNLSPVVSHKGDCSNKCFVYTGNFEKVPRDGLGYCDYACCGADFTTGEDFGCIHFEE